MSRIPDLPGNAIPHNSEQANWLRQRVSQLCQLDHQRFPGSQPVSFGMRDLAKLESQDYWVCEKSDGQRVLLLILTDRVAKDQSVYIIDRKNGYRELNNLYFPHYNNNTMPLGSTIVDGELVFDVDPRTKKQTMRFLAFDCLVADEQNIMSRPLDKRYGRLTEWFYKPYRKMMEDYPRMADTQPFNIKVKENSFSYHVEKVFEVDIPALQHGNDGLIYTCANTPYTPGTDINILKWKPPSENSIDFKLVLRFPPLASKPDQPDLFAKPVFALHAYHGDERRVAKYEPYDEMYVDDEEWEKMKASGEQLDDRIVEVHWDSAGGHWRMMRFRDDKENGNHISVVENIIQSIVDGVEKGTLLERSTAIRQAWKARHGQHEQQRAALPPPPPQPVRSLPAKPRGATQDEIRYGPLATSPWSKVGGPEIVGGMKR